MARRLCLAIGLLAIAVTSTALADGSFKGKLNCTFDNSALLNTSDLSQPFIINCKEIVKPSSNLWFWIIFGVIFGGFFGLPLLVVFIGWLCECTPRAMAKLKEFRDQCLERRRERATAKAEAKAQAKLQAKVEALAGDHPYQLT